MASGGGSTRGQGGSGGFLGVWERGVGVKGGGLLGGGGQNNMKRR